MSISTSNYQINTARTPMHFEDSIDTYNESTSSNVKLFNNLASSNTSIEENLDSPGYKRSLLSTRDLSLQKADSSYSLLAKKEARKASKKIEFDSFLQAASDFWSQRLEEEEANEKLNKKTPSSATFKSGFNHTEQAQYLSSPEVSNLRAEFDQFNTKITDSEINPLNSNLFPSYPLTAPAENIQWNSQLDEVLLSLAYELNHDWQAIAKRFPQQSCTVKDLKERFHTLNDVTLPNKARFSAQEDAKVLRLYETYGTNWKAIAAMLPGRNAIMVKNRYYSSLRLKPKKSLSDQDSPSDQEKQKSGKQKKKRGTFPELESLQQIPKHEMIVEDEEKSSRYEDTSQSTPSASFNSRVDGPVGSDCDHFFDFSEKDATFGENDRNEVNTFSAVPIWKGREESITNRNQLVPKSLSSDNISGQVYNYEQPERNNNGFSNGFTQLQNFMEMTRQTPNASVEELNERVNFLTNFCFEILSEMETIKKNMK